MTKKVIGITAALVLCAALVLPLNAQTSLLHEDFESAFPPSGWTRVVEGGSNQWYRNDQYGYDPTNRQAYQVVEAAWIGICFVS